MLVSDCIFCPRKSHRVEYPVTSGNFDRQELHSSRDVVWRDRSKRIGGGGGVGRSIWKCGYKWVYRLRDFSNFLSIILSMFFCLYIEKNITRRLEVMNFVFSWQKQLFRDWSKSIGGWARASGNVVDKKHMAHPLLRHKNDWPTRKARLEIAWPAP